MKSYRSLKEAQEVFHDQLQGLDPVGDYGFEAFLASALSELTGCAFRVAKSGPQDGTDVRSAPHNLFKIGLEGKRYAPSTQLPLDELLHKITDASNARVPVDLWLLAATRPVSVSDREKLHDHGETVGIGIIVFDRPSDLTRLCDLTVICASAPSTCKTFLKSESTTAMLDYIRSDTDFERMRSEILDRLTRSDTGYDSARLASERWMVKAQDSLANAKSRLGGQHNLRESKYGVIPRATINGQLDAWNAGRTGVAALLGDEGTGKSWASLEWYNALRSSELGAPLTVFLTAKATNTAEDVRLTLAKALAKQTGSFSVRFWEKRLALWERSGGRTEILLLLDGLNENFNFVDWAEWLQPLFEDSLAHMYRVVVSCWPNWWKASLAELANLTPRPEEIVVSRFNDSELDALLAAMDVQRSDFASGVLELMRVPRLSSLVARYRKKLQNSGDVTPERVVYEDWKDRLSRRGPKTGLTDPEMKAFVAGLGTKLKQNVDQAVTRRDVIKRLSDESGKDSLELRAAVSELTSGAWLVPANDPHTFKVAPDRIPFVLGATLLSEIRKETEVPAVEAMIAEFLDPLKDHSLGAAILRTATTIALIEADTSPEFRETLLCRWLDEQNFGIPDFEAFWRLAGLDPELFFNLAETRWLTRSGRSLSDEVLIKTFANAADFSDFEEHLKIRLAKWLATAWPDPMVGAVIGKLDQTKQDSQQRAAKTLANHAAWVSSETAKSFTSIAIDNNEGWSWLSHRALAILSYLKRSPFVCVFEAWALSRAIMQRPRHEAEVAWILRLNSKDADETCEEITGKIARLKAPGHHICDQASVYLEIAMSSVERANTSRELDVTPEEALATLDATVLDAIGLYEAARKYLSPFGWKTHDPASGVALINELIERGLGGNEAALGLLVDNLHDILIVLTPGGHTRLCEAIEAERAALEGDSEEKRAGAVKLDSAQLTLQFYDAEPGEQSTLVLSRGLGQRLQTWLPFCRPITWRDIARINLNDTPDGHVAGWLDYLFERLPKEEIAKLDFLPELIAHADDDVRHKALVLASHGRHLPALQVFVDSPHSEFPKGEERPKPGHEYWRNRALLEFCGFTPEPSMSEIMSPEYVALVAENRMTDPQALEPFNEYLHGEFEALRTERSWSRPRYWCSYRRAICALVEYNLDAVLKWLEPWLENPDIRTQSGLMNHFPMIDTMQALRAKAPEVSLNIYRILTDKSQKGLFSTEGILNFPFEVPKSENTDGLCNELLEEATTDKSLLEIAYSAFLNDRRDWLFDRIERLEASQTPTDVAKAYTLLGFCDECHDADTAWGIFPKRPPKDQWLDGVMRSSATDYARNRAARKALTDFWSNNDAGAARHALKDVVEACDLRIRLWFEEINPDWKYPPFGRWVALDLTTPSLNQAVKRNLETRKKKLFHTPIPYSIMAPWK